MLSGVISVFCYFSDCFVFCVSLFSHVFLTWALYFYCAVHCFFKRIFGLFCLKIYCRLGFNTEQWNQRQDTLALIERLLCPDYVFDSLNSLQVLCLIQFCFVAEKRQALANHQGLFVLVFFLTNISLSNCKCLNFSVCTVFAGLVKIWSSKINSCWFPVSHWCFIRLKKKANCCGHSKLVLLLMVNGWVIELRRYLLFAPWWLCFGVIMLYHSFNVLPFRRP